MITSICLDPITIWKMIDFDYGFVFGYSLNDYVDIVFNSMGHVQLIEK